MPTLYETVHQACFKKDYSHYKRELERDQVSTEKAFWMAAIQLLNTQNKFPFFQVYKFYVDLLYDRPALELQLVRNLSQIDDINPSLSNSDQRQLKQKIQTAKYIRNELVDVINNILEDADKKPTKIQLTLSKSHQPYLPSPKLILRALSYLIHNSVEITDIFYPNSEAMNLTQLNQFRKIANEYFPYFLFRIALDKISHFKDSTLESITFREAIDSPKKAVEIHISRYPWDINLNDDQLSYVITHSYSARTITTNGDIQENLFDSQSIRKAIRRFRGMKN